jgi:hypothetical protein
MLSIIQKALTFFAAKTHTPLSFGRGLCGLPGLLDLVTNG